jgi:hypothetical protein
MRVFRRSVPRGSVGSVDYRATLRSRSPMSVVGPKRTWFMDRSMSALPRYSDIEALPLQPVTPNPFVHRRAHWRHNSERLAH